MASFHVMSECPPSGKSETSFSSDVTSTSSASQSADALAATSGDAAKKYDQLLKGSRLVPSRQPCVRLPGLVLATAYGASMGGMATMTGSPPNVVVKQIADRFWPANDLNYLSFMVFNLPTSLLMAVLCWIWLAILFVHPKEMFSRDRDRSAAKIREIIRRKHEALGSLKATEIVVSIHFLLLMLLWLTRKPEIFPGWSSLFQAGYVDDTVSAVLICLLLFILPAENPLRVRAGWSGGYSFEPLLRWDFVQQKVSWGVLILLGAGLSLADAAEKSGLSKLIADRMEFLLMLPRFGTLILLITFIALMTEFTSNTAVASLLLPIVAELSVKGKMHPFYLLMPACTATSMAFMVPVATPPNAIAYSFGGIRTTDMAAAGAVMNVIGILLISLSAHVWGNAWFKLDHLPHYAILNAVNETAVNAIHPTNHSSGI